MNTLRGLDVLVIAGYFLAMLAMGGVFSRRSKSKDGYFVGQRSYPGWVAGFSLFGAQISSITFVAYPADAFKTAWLRYLLCLTLPISVYLAARFFLPVFRRAKVTSVFEYLEARFGPKTRVYGACVFIASQCIRLSMIQYLVAVLMHRLTGWSVPMCLLLGGVVTAYYTIVGGFDAVIWTDVVQSVILTLGGLLIMGTLLWRMPGGVSSLLQVGVQDGKFLFGEADPEGRIRSIPWALTFSHKNVVFLLVVGVLQWLTDYVTNQEVIQRYCAARSTRDAQRAIWICCWACLPTWGYFMLVGTALYVFYNFFPDPNVTAMLSGAKKAEDIVPFFVTTQLGSGWTGLVIAAVLAAAMSSMSSAMNSISAVAITDLYQRHLAPQRSESTYIRAAQWVTLGSSLIMMGGAWWLFNAKTTTLQNLWTEFQSIIAGGLLGLFLLGFLTRRVQGRAVGIGIVCALLFSTVMSLSALELLPMGWTAAIEKHFDPYYTGIVGNVLCFGVGFLVSVLFPGSPKAEIHGLTVWTAQDDQNLDRS